MINNNIDNKINNKQREIKLEQSAMAVVVLGNKLLTTKELIYDKEVVSLPKGHVEPNEELVDTAIRECFEETNVVITQNDLVRQLTPHTYEFVTPQNQSIRKIVTPFLFRVSEAGNLMAKEPRMIEVKWMDVDLFTQLCPYDAVKALIKEIR